MASSDGKTSLHLSDSKLISCRCSSVLLFFSYSSQWPSKVLDNVFDVIELQVEQMKEQSTKFFFDLSVYIYIEHRGTP